MAEFDVCMVADRKYMQHMLEVAFNMAVMHMNDHINLHVITESAVQFKDSQHMFGLPQVSAVFHSAKEIEDVLAELKLGESELRQTKFAYAKMLIFKLMPKKKFLYIDTDCLFARANALNELFSIDVSEHGIAAVEDFAVKFADREEMNVCATTDYFNTGVMLVDPNQPAMGSFFDKLLETLKSHKLQFKYADQSVINAVAKGRFTKLDNKYNVIPQQIVNSRFIDTLKPKYNSLQELYDNAKIIHFAGYSCPWKIDAMSTAWLKSHPETWNYVSFYKNNKLNILEWMANNNLLPKYQEIVNL